MRDPSNQRKSFRDLPDLFAYIQVDSVLYIIHDLGHALIIEVLLLGGHLLLNLKFLDGFLIVASEVLRRGIVRSVK